ncbi:MAG: aspartate aminotransferase family protein [Phycisphaerales bacterium]|nr:aspartate aminotransferase family protein [Phycisphaerales bacterium]
MTTMQLSNELKKKFWNQIAQTSPNPLGIVPTKAKGIYIWDIAGKKYIDGCSGIHVTNIGHCPTAVIETIHQQVEKYLHLTVYGEMIISPQVAFASVLLQHLPSSLSNVYFTNSGSEAIEGALKLARKYTGRQKIIACKNAYHGSTLGALSIIGNKKWQKPFEPLLPKVEHYSFNSDNLIKAINNKTACVVLETIQGEAGLIKPDKEWINAVALQCKKKGALLILDENQVAFGRTGKIWAFEAYKIVPDILVLGKSLGGGLPLGAFIAHKKVMQTLSMNPILGHITTFGGHPLCCVSGLSSFQELLKKKYIKDIPKKETYLRKHLIHPTIKEVRHAGLWFCIVFKNEDINMKVRQQCLKNGLLTDLFIFSPECLRIAPPLSINFKELETLTHILLKSIRAVAV